MHYTKDIRRSFGKFSQLWLQFVVDNENGKLGRVAQGGAFRLWTLRELGFYIFVQLRKRIASQSTVTTDCQAIHKEEFSLECLACVVDLILKEA